MVSDVKTVLKSLQIRVVKFKITQIEQLQTVNGNFKNVTTFSCGLKLTTTNAQLVFGIGRSFQNNALWKKAIT